jgi:Zn-dependent protease with chaperone function
MFSTRRQFIGTAASTCAYCTLAHSTALMTTLQPLVPEGYKPADNDERGMWQTFDRFEEELANSTLLLEAPDLRAYSLEVLERLLGRSPKEVRLYIVRDSSFNASMAPTGLMMVHTGFLAHVRNEAQYAAVLGHEAGHYFRKHSLQHWRDARTKSAVGAFVAAGANAIGGYSAINGVDGRSWIDLANAINTNLLLSIFRFQRSQEAEADAYGISLMANAGYSPDAAATVWAQLIEERRRSAKARNKRFRANTVDAFSTHPPEATRMRDLSDTASVLLTKNAEREFTAGTDRWRAAIAPHRGDLLDEQIKLNDPGASLYLIESHAQDGWNGLLRFQEGEVYRLRGSEGDGDKAAQSFAAAIGFDDAPPAAWRAHGYAQLKAGHRFEGEHALARYLELAPEAKDAAMVRMALGQ